MGIVKFEIQYKCSKKDNCAKKFLCEKYPANIQDFRKKAKLDGDVQTISGDDNNREKILVFYCALTQRCKTV